LVRIPTLKHWQITGWYMTPSEDYGGLSPRSYLRGKKLAGARAGGISGFNQGRRVKTMSKVNLKDLSTEELVRRFIELGLDQDKALLYDELAQFGRLFKQMQEVVEELKRRPGDQSQALLELYDHPNLQVRLKAVKNSLAIAPAEGRRVLQDIADSREYPQAMEAGMSLDNLDSGVFKPT
jgi:hypothetical protein